MPVVIRSASFLAVADQALMAKRGRRPLFEDGSERIDIRLSLAVYDALCKEAALRGEDVRVLARRILTIGISAVENRRASTSS